MPAATVKRGRSGPETGLAWLDRAAGWLAVMGATAVILLVILTVTAVVFRYVLNDPIFGIDDLSQVGLSLVVAGSIAYGGRAGAHVHVDVLHMIGGRRVTRYTDVLVRAIGAFVVGLTAYALIRQGLCGTRCGHFTANLAIPHLPFYLVLAVSMAIYAAILALELVVGLVHFGAGRDPHEDR